MAANINDKFTETTNGGRPIPTELQIQKNIGAAQITVGSTGGWAVATAVHFIMYKKDAQGNKIDGSQTDWKGIVLDASTIGSLQLKAGADDIYPIGSVIVAAPTAAWADDVVEGLAVSHSQDGKLKNAAVKEALGADGNLVQTISETVGDGVVSGGIWSSTNLLANMTALVAYFDGLRVTSPAITSKVLTATRDTYVRLAKDGTISYAEVTVGAAEPTLPADTITISKLTTNATVVTANTSLNRGVVKAENIDFTTFQPTAFGAGTTSNKDTNTVVANIPNYNFIAGRKYLIFATMTMTVSLGGGAIWEAQVRVNSVNLRGYRISSRNGESGIQTGMTIMLLYTAPSTQTTSVDLFVTRLLNDNQLNVGAPTITVIPQAAA